MKNKEESKKETKKNQSREQKQKKINIRSQYTTLCGVASRNQNKGIVKQGKFYNKTCAYLNKKGV